MIGDNYITLTGLHTRKWTDFWVGMLLGLPDRLVANRRGSAPVRLYSMERVIKAERSEEFQEFLRVHARRCAMIARRKTRKAELRKAELARPDNRNG